jgi:hypothetical protein
MDVKLNLTNSEHKDLTSYCNLNDLLISEVVKKSFTTGFNIEKYGLLGAEQEKRVEVEVIREKLVEIPVEVIREVVKVEYVEVPIEKLVEVIKEVEVEKLVEVIKEVEVEKIVEVVKEVEVEKLVEVIKEVEVTKEVFVDVPVEKIVTKIEYICDNAQENELLLKIQEMENIFQNEMSKKEQELDEIRQELDKQLDRPPVEKIVEVVVEKEKIVEVVVEKEKIVEVVVEKEITDNSLKPKLDALQNTLTKIRQETLDKDKKIKELEQTIQEIQKFQDNKQAVYLKGSNLDDKLYK